MPSTKALHDAAIADLENSEATHAPDRCFSRNLIFSRHQRRQVHRIKTQRPFLAALWLLSASITTHAAIAETQIGTVDMTKLRDSPDFRAAMEALRTEFEPRRQELLHLRSEAKSHPNDDTLQQQFNRQAIEFQNRAYTARTETTQKAERSIIEVIRAYAVTEYYDVVASADLLLMQAPLGAHSAPVDITSKVQARMRDPHTSPSPMPAEGASGSPAMKIGVMTGSQAS